MNTLTQKMLNASGDERLLLCPGEIVRLSPKSPVKATRTVIKRTNQHRGQQQTFKLQKKKLFIKE